MTAGLWDLADIASALATRFGTVTAPTGLAAIASYSSELPENIGTTPAVIVFPPGVEDINFSPSRRDAVFTFRVVFFYDYSKDLPRRVADLYQWFQSLYNVYPTSTSIQLGLAFPNYAWITGAGIIPSAVYGDTTYPAIELRVSVSLTEALA